MSTCPQSDWVIVDVTLDSTRLTTTDIILPPDSNGYRTLCPTIPLCNPDLQSLLAGCGGEFVSISGLEGLALAVIWLGAMFWIGFGLDYLPVLMGASEMPAVARGRAARSRRAWRWPSSSTAGFSAARLCGWATAAWRCSWSGDSAAFTTAW